MPGGIQPYAGNTSLQALPHQLLLILLLLAFSVAGIALLALLFVCNLTVTEGTIWGLIFYANITAKNGVLRYTPGALCHPSY